MKELRLFPEIWKILSGSMLKLIGQEARKDIETLMGTRIHLQLWVKVRENWRNRMDDLRTLGYEDKE